MPLLGFGRLPADGRPSGRGQGRWSGSSTHGPAGRTPFGSKSTCTYMVQARLFSMTMRLSRRAGRGWGGQRLLSPLARNVNVSVIRDLEPSEVS